MNANVTARERILAKWLVIIALLVFCMVAVGGLTRLTGSGLSMVEWKVVSGILPPLHQADWVASFEKYKQFPEFREHNHWMELSDYKEIFFLEYFHRLLGRLVGLSVLVPLLFFWIRGWLNTRQKKAYTFLFLLITFQGLIGWFMVKSGLVDRPHVSQYRLVLHLFLAGLTLSFCLWHVWSLLYDRRQATPTLRWGKSLAFLLGIQIVMGGFVAGLKAGHSYNSYPKMLGRWFPDALWTYSPFWVNFTENPVMVQFIHRHLGILAALSVLVFSAYHLRAGAQGKQRFALFALTGIVLIQVLLGIGTLIMYVPVSLASIHQMVAIILWMVMLFLLHPAAQQKNGAVQTA